MLFFSDFRRHVRHFFGVGLELARPSEAWCFFSPGCDFFEAVLLQQPQATESVEKCCFSVRGMVFPCPGGDCCLITSSRRQQNLSKNLSKVLFSSDFRRHVRHFFAVVLELARPLEACCFPPGRWLFRSCFTAAAAGNRICQKKLFFCQRHGVSLVPSLVYKWVIT